MKAIKITIETLKGSYTAEAHTQEGGEPIDLQKTLPKLKRDIQDLCIDYGFDFKQGDKW